MCNLLKTNFSTLESYIQNVKRQQFPMKSITIATVRRQGPQLKDNKLLLVTRHNINDFRSINNGPITMTLLSCFAAHSQVTYEINILMTINKINNATYVWKVDIRVSQVC